MPYKVSTNGVFNFYLQQLTISRGGL